MTSHGWRVISGKPAAELVPTDDSPDEESCELVSESTPTPAPADAADTAAAWLKYWAARLEALPGSEPG